MSCCTLFHGALSISRSNWVKANGILYQKPCVLRVENDYPVFGKLENIYLVINRVLFHVAVLETRNFNKHLQAYTIDYTSNLEIIIHTQLVIPLPVHIHRVTLMDTSQSVIVCKHHICTTLY